MFSISLLNSRILKLKTMWQLGSGYTHNHPLDLNSASFFFLNINFHSMSSSYLSQIVIDIKINII